MSRKSLVLSDRSLEATEAFVREVVRLGHQLRVLFEPLNDVCPGGAQTSGLLRSLVLSGPQTVAQLARSRHVSRQWMQRTIKSLQAQGLVELKDNPRHKQSRQVCATLQGVRTAIRLQQAATPILRDLVPKSVPKDSLHLTLFVLMQVNGTIDEILKRAFGELDGEFDAAASVAAKNRTPRRR